MANFLTRIELHEANYADYLTLHTAMERAGFSRTIKADNGSTYQLPTAEYYVSGQYTIEAVQKAASNAAATTNKKFGAITAQAESMKWEGLPLAVPAKSHLR